MSIILRDYQERAVEQALFGMKLDGNDLLCLATGAGKSIIVAEIVNRLQKKCLILQPSKEILVQNLEKLRHYVPEHEIGVFSASMNRKVVNKYTLATIQSIYQKPWLFDDIGLILLDEAHGHNIKNTDGMYSKFFQAIGSPKVIGLTATPYRNMTGYHTDKATNQLYSTTTLKLINRVKPDFWKRILVNVGIGDLISQGYLCPLEYEDRSFMKHEDMKLNKTGTEFDFDAFDKTLKTKQEQIAECVYDAQQRFKSVLVFCPSVSAADSYARTISGSRSVSAKTPADERDFIIRQFKNGDVQTVFNMGVLTTGFDHPELDCIILLRPTRSLPLYMQMCLDMETEILTRRGFVKYEDFDIETDEVAAMDTLDNSIKWTKCSDVTYRPINANERFVFAKGPQVDLRVTNQHDLLARARSCKKYLKRTADQLLNRKDMFCLPISGVEVRGGSSLTKAELNFLGLFLSDGTLGKTNNAISITQSFVYPEIIAKIRQTLTDCGFKFGEHIRQRKGQDAMYADVIVFTVSYGKPRGRDKHKKGWSHLERYINKNLSKSYESLSAEQVGFLLEGILWGDGDKNSIDYVRHTTRIALGVNKLYAERLQSLLIRSGYKCNLTTQRQHGNRVQYLAYVGKKEYITLPGQNCKDGSIAGKPISQRTRLTVDAVSDEMVWCVTNQYGTIITRRNGKVLIMGNCGRGVRIADGKTHCTVIDWTSTVKQLGKIETVQIRKEKFPEFQHPMWEIFSTTEKGEERWHNRALYSFAVKPKSTSFYAHRAIMKKQGRIF